MRLADHTPKTKGRVSTGALSSIACAASFAALRGEIGFNSHKALLELVQLSSKPTEILLRCRHRILYGAAHAIRHNGRSALSPANGVINGLLGTLPSKRSRADGRLHGLCHRLANAVGKSLPRAFACAVVSHSS
jgi:hypothetical protein